MERRKVIKGVKVVKDDSIRCKVNILKKCWKALEEDFSFQFSKAPWEPIVVW